MALLCIACSGDSDSNSSNPFVGTWKCNGNYGISVDTYTFNADGTFIGKQSDGSSESISGQWSYNEQTGLLSILKSSGWTRVFIVVSLTDSYFVIMDNDGDSYTYYKQTNNNNNHNNGNGESGNGGGTNTSSTGKQNGHQWVDLGLSVKWATMNIGASSPEDYGNYYAWGETTTKSTYDWLTYKWCNGSYYTLTKYCTTSKWGTVDNKTTLDLKDDAAHANWGGTWRMPTVDEIKELKEKCNWEWTTQSGVNGQKVTGPNGNSIFLPAAGIRWDDRLNRAGYGGDYWSSSFCPGGDTYAYELGFNSDGTYWDDYYRSYGQSVRAVCP